MTYNRAKLNHSGLFAPRAGQHYRDEQRRRRSRYDRGTRLAALEEFDYEDFYHVNEEFQSHSCKNTASPTAKTLASALTIAQPKD